MTNNEFMGLLIGCLATLLSIGSIIVAIVVKPVINLNKSITKLNDSIDHLNSQNTTLEQRITKHGKEIDELENEVIIQGTEIKHIKEKLK